MELLEAMKRISADRTLAKEFSQEPEPTLKSLGVDMSKIRIRRDGEQAYPVHVCVSVGAGLCASAGTTIEI
jgi:hypothetical protein